MEYVQRSSKAASLEFMGPAHHVRLWLKFLFCRDALLFILKRHNIFRMHLGSVLCSTVATDPHYKVLPFFFLPPLLITIYIMFWTLQVIKSACAAARCVPPSAIIPKGVKDVASRFVTVTSFRLFCCFFFCHVSSRNVSF